MTTTFRIRGRRRRACAAALTTTLLAASAALLFPGSAVADDEATAAEAGVTGVTAAEETAVESTDDTAADPADESVAESAPAAPTAADPVQEAPAAADTVSIDVVTINDFHGRIEFDGESAGAAVLAGAVQQLRADNPNTIFAAAGDLIGASTFTSSIQNDAPTIDALNAAGLEVSAAGNHEFDRGWADLRDRVQSRADWEYLSANVFLQDTGEHALAPSWVKEVDGVRIGFVGAVTEELPSLVMPGTISELEVRDIAASVEQAAADLRDGDPANGESDVTVLLVHEGAANIDVASITPDSPLGRIVHGVGDGVDAIVSAHTHLAYNHVIDGRPVVSAGQYGENIGLMNLRVDLETKELVSITNEVKSLTADEEPLYPAVPEVQAVVDGAVTEAETIGRRSVGQILADLDRGRQSDGTTENRGAESTLGNFVAETHRWATGADLALMMPGGIRDDLTFASSGADDPDGNVMYREASDLQPWAGTIMTMDLTGAQIEQVLEEQWQPAGASRPLLRLGASEGFGYVYDPTAARGERIASMTLHGEPVDPDRAYRVAATEYLALGGDNFSTFAEGANVRDSGRVDFQSMIDWFAEHGPAAPDLTQRSVGVVLEPADADGYTAGDRVEVAFSSLAFTAGEPAPGAATLSLNGEQLATGAIDPTVVDASDEGGRVTLGFTVPEGVVGAQTLVLEVADSGTRAEVPIVFDEASAGVGGADGDADAGDADAGGAGAGGAGAGGGAAGSGDAGSSGAGQQLSRTGAEAGPWIALAAVLVVLGLALTAARRRA